MLDHFHDLLLGILHPVFPKSLRVYDVPPQPTTIRPEHYPWRDTQPDCYHGAPVISILQPLALKYPYGRTRYLLNVLGELYRFDSNEAKFQILRRDIVHLTTLNGHVVYISRNGEVNIEGRKPIRRFKASYGVRRIDEYRDTKGLFLVILTNDNRLYKVTDQLRFPLFKSPVVEYTRQSTYRFTAFSVGEEGMIF